MIATEGVAAMSKSAPTTMAQTTATFGARTVLGRVGTPEDIAACVLFLASDAASDITGQTLVCDGGYLIG